jgi:hypothetical protein
MKNIFVICSILFCVSCSTSTSENTTSDFTDDPNPNPSTPDSGWLIPQSEVLDGGPGKDGIPALVNPNFTDVQGATYLNDSDLVIGFKNGNDVRAYPHAILDWHEIVNDNINEVSVAITYCPLTGTGIGWDRIVFRGEETTFGVSGLLYNTNLIPYDRATDSNWSQILNKSVNGRLIGQEAELIGLFETDWKTWKTIYPDTKVLSNETGFNRTYGSSPYGDYNNLDDFFLFPVSKDRRLPLKERVLAIVSGGQAKVYRFSDFQSDNIIKDSFNGEDYLIVGNPNFIMSFKLTDDLSTLNFEYVFNNSELLLSDNEGNQWDIFGKAVTGPRSGTQLDHSSSLMGFWFSIPAFYETKIYGY